MNKMGFGFLRLPKVGEGWKIQPVYEQTTQTRGKASACVGCRQCERNCPQKLEITTYLRDVAEAFEK